MQRNLKIRGQVPIGSKSNPDKEQANLLSLLRFRDIFFICLKHWIWFLLSISICLGIGIYIVKKTPNLYQCSSSILIKCEDKNVGSMSVFRELGIDVAPTNVTNEILSLKSKDIASMTASILNLDVEYYRESTFHDVLLYGDEVPVSITFIDNGLHYPASFRLRSIGNNSLLISDMRINGIETTQHIRINYDDTVRCTICDLVINAIPGNSPFDILVKKVSLDEATNKLRERLSFSQNSKEAALVDIRYSDYSAKRAEDVLNTLIDVYDRKWIKDQSQISLSTNRFITERLSVIERELNDVERNIANYKSTNLIPDVDMAGANAVTKVNANEEEIDQLNSKLYMADYLLDFIKDDVHRNQLIPHNIILANEGIERQIVKYNEVLLQQLGFLSHTSAQNPLVQDLQESLTIMRNSIINSINNEIILLSDQLDILTAKYEREIEKIMANPEQTTYIASIERQQKVKESLYLFLLQKREENELSMAFTPSNIRIIEPPNGLMNPIQPKPYLVYSIAIIVGFVLPSIIFILKEILNTKVRNRKDLEHLSVPIIGEIPLDKKAKTQSVKKSRKSKYRRGKPVVQEGRRDALNEGFRVVRANMEFVLEAEKRHHKVMLTSMSPMAGKTFCSANLATTFALKGCKVIAVDLDLRKGNLSKYAISTAHGVSDYLSGLTDDFRGSIQSIGNIDILPAGKLPPNPAELLCNSRFKTMIDFLNEIYDIVFLDCPPIDLVADTSIISQYADMTIFVIRANRFERTYLDDIESWYLNERFRKFTLLLNGINIDSRGYGGRYNYGGYGA